MDSLKAKGWEQSLDWKTDPLRAKSLEKSFD
jgi:hypothetical protein